MPVEHVQPAKKLQQTQALFGKSDLQEDRDWSIPVVRRTPIETDPLLCSILQPNGICQQIKRCTHLTNCDIMFCHYAAAAQHLACFVLYDTVGSEKCDAVMVHHHHNTCVTSLVTDVIKHVDQVNSLSLVNTTGQC